MTTWTNQDLDDFCEQAIERLNKNKSLNLVFVNCWLFSNSAGSNLHLVYRDEFLNKEFDLSTNGRILNDEINYRIDAIAGIDKVKDPKSRIILRIARWVYLDCAHNRRDK